MFAQVWYSSAHLIVSEKLENWAHQAPLQKNKPGKCVESSTTHCPILLKLGNLVHYGSVNFGLIIKAENKRRDGRPQVAMHR